MDERFRFLLVKLRALTGITSKGIIAEGLSGLEMGKRYLSRFEQRRAREAGVVSEPVAYSESSRT